MWPDQDAIGASPARVSVLDSGLRGGRENNALDRAWLRLHAAGRGPALLRFCRSTPSASVGAFQAVDRELRLDHCRRRGIEVSRRPSGGGALYLDPGQLGVSLVCHRRAVSESPGLEQMLRRFCLALCAGLEGLGIRTRIKQPNDLEIDGRKIASAFAVQEGDSALLTATLLLDADIRAMLETLRVPTEKLSPDGLAAARHRLATVKDLLGEVPPLAAVRGAVQAGMAAVLQLKLEAAGDGLLAGCLPDDALAREDALALGRDWSQSAGLESLWKGAGGTLRCRAGIEGGRFTAVQFAGDFHLSPTAALADLERTLEGVAVEAAGTRIEAFFSAREVDNPGLAPADFVRAVRRVADQRALQAQLGLDHDEAATLMVYSGDGACASRILEQAQVMLVPYCAKPAWCKWRFRVGCPQCGLCEVGEAYRLGRERGMQVITITHYEHLVETLRRMKGSGMRAYVGMCCGNFFLKRFHAFKEAGMDALLMDISGSNCYELKQEEQAYAGQFQAQARLNAEVLAKVMTGVPGVTPCADLDHGPDDR